MSHDVADLLPEGGTNGGQAELTQEDEDARRRPTGT